MAESGYPAPGRSATLEEGYAPSDALRQIRIASLALVAIALIGTAGYMLLLGWLFLDALYMTVISMTTVGYKEVHNLSNELIGQVWTMLILLTGVGTLFYAAVSFVELVVEGYSTRVLRKEESEGRDRQTERPLRAVRLRSRRPPGSPRVRRRRHEVRSGGPAGG